MIQYKRHKQALSKVKDIVSNSENCLIIHYSCESFVDKEDSGTPRITEIKYKE